MALKNCERCGRIFNIVYVIPKILCPNCKKTLSYPKRKEKICQVRKARYWKDLEKVREYCQKHKNKNLSRSLTYYILQQHPELLPYICDTCGRKSHLQIHHIIYPLNSVGIIESIKSHQIFYLCYTCHGKLLPQRLTILETEIFIS